MSLNTYIMRQQMKWLRRRIAKDVEKNEEKARKKLLRAFPPLLDIFDIEDEFKNEKGHKEVRIITVQDLPLYPTDKLVELFDQMIANLETKV